MNLSTFLGRFTHKLISLSGYLHWNLCNLQVRTMGKQKYCVFY